jgi:hypothetical protein
MRETARGGSVASACVEARGLRAIAAHSRGGITLIVAGHRVEEAWAREVEELSELLRAMAPDLVYAAIRRGWRVSAALHDDLTLYDDWPTRPGYRPRGGAGTVVAFQDLFAPDAFGVQLLGAGNADRLPLLGESAAHWGSELVGEATLLAHVEPERWLAVPPVRLVGHNTVEVNTQATALLESARSDLAGILYRPGALGAYGFADMTDR